MLLQTLNILEQFDLQAMGRNSADYLHTVVEAMKLAYADRDSYYADPAFVRVPAEGLLSKEYAQERARRRSTRARVARLSRRRPAAVRLRRSRAWPLLDRERPRRRRQQQPRAGATDPTAGIVKDTTHISVIDKRRQHVRPTPSGGWIRGASILGDTGIGMSVRGEAVLARHDARRRSCGRGRARATR